MVQMCRKNKNGMKTSKHAERAVRAGKHQGRNTSTGLERVNSFQSHDFFMFFQHPEMFYKT